MISKNDQRFLAYTLTVLGLLPLVWECIHRWGLLISAMLNRILYFIKLPALRAKVAYAKAVLVTTVIGLKLVRL